jgi:dipeptidyl aminopeptidase/acylaminoacyl peptidase
MKVFYWCLQAGMVLLLSACWGGNPTRLAEPGTPTTAERSALTSTSTIEVPLPRLTLTPTLTVIPTQIPTSSPTASLTPTPDPYYEYTIEYLEQRTYGGGELQIEQILAENSYFTRYLVSYPSDGLRIFGFMDVPQGEGPFPVVIAVHGYIEPSIYQTLDYTTGYADALARANYLVIHPNLRGYPPSDDGPNLFRVGMAVDVLNLIAIVKQQAGQPGVLELADAAHLGMWGHSMGGGITIRVITVSHDVSAAVLYGAMSGDERKNFERVFDVFSDGQRGQEELSVPEEALKRISPIYFLDRIQATVSIHHGENDGEVPPEWSQDLCQRLQDLGKSVECFTYPGQPHTFNGDSEQLLIQRMIEFYDRYLKTS